jgi:hypothetical protein
MWRKGRDGASFSGPDVRRDGRDLGSSYRSIVFFGDGLYDTTFSRKMFAHR